MMRSSLTRGKTITRNELELALELFVGSLAFTEKTRKFLAKNALLIELIWGSVHPNSRGL
jgi:hypothetical protein